MRNKIVGIFRCTFAWKQKNIQNIWKLALGLNAIKLKFAVFNYSDEIERVTLSQRALREHVRAHPRPLNELHCIDTIF